MSSTSLDLAALAQSIKDWGRELGFQQVGIADVQLGEHEAHLQRWLDAGYQGEMDYMAAHGSKRSHPDELVPGTLRVVSLRMDYLPGDTQMAQRLAQPEKAYVSRYALGRDYHKLIRKRLQQLAERIQQQIGPFGYRAFVDSAPVLEKAIAEQAGLGWIGKNTLVLNRKAGSYFFLGELFVDLPLPVDAPHGSEHCGRCSACLDICPTAAFVGPYVLDARRCISYLTIELKGAIPVDLRPLIGNRVFGCDDCQIVCPWNRFAKPSGEGDFKPRHNLDNAELAAIAAFIYERGGVVAAVCHGPAGLVNLKLSDGGYLVTGKDVSAFTNEEERAVGLYDTVPFLLADALQERGARHVPAANFQAQVVASERLVTGQNPASAKGVAEAMLPLLAVTAEKRA